jgi:hypothetical protein
VSYVERFPVQELDWYDAASRLTTQSPLCGMSGQIAHILHRHSLHQNVVATPLGICNTGLDIRAALDVGMNTPVSCNLMASNAEVLEIYHTSFSLRSNFTKALLCPQIRPCHAYNFSRSLPFQHTILLYLRSEAPFLKCIIQHKDKTVEFRAYPKQGSKSQYAVLYQTSIWQQVNQRKLYLQAAYTSIKGFVGSTNYSLLIIIIIIIIIIITYVRQYRHKQRAIIILDTVTRRN